MDVTHDLLREAAQILSKNNIPAPYCASLTKYGVAFWVWIDENGEFVPPPQTVDQPTVAQP